MQMNRMTLNKENIKNMYGGVQELLYDLLGTNTALAVSLVGLPIFAYGLYKLHSYIEPLYLSVENTNQHGGELVANVFAAHGVKYVFTLVGGHISPILVASKKIGINVIDVRNEATTVFAADSVSRLSGIPGVAIVTAGPGVTNTITAMKNAQMAQSPLILIGGAAATVLKGRGSLQDVEQISVLKSIVKYSASITNLRQIVPTMKRAFHEAMSGVPGPVFVEIPIDCLYCIGEIRAAMGLGQSMRRKVLPKEEIPKVIVPSEYLRENNINNSESKEISIITKYLDSISPDYPVFTKTHKKLPFIVSTYLEYMLKYIYCGTFNRIWDFTPLKINPLMPSDKQCKNIISLLIKSKKPVMIISSQALLNPNQKEQIREAVEWLGIPCFLSGMARGLLGRESDYIGNNSRSNITSNKNARFLHIRQNRRQALKESDLIILAGVMPDFRLDYGRSLSSKAKIIAINRSHFDLNLNTDLFWKPYLKCQYDVGLTLIKCSNIIKNNKNIKYNNLLKNEWNLWINELLNRSKIKDEKNSSKSLTPSFARNLPGMKQEKLINPLYLCKQIDSLMSDNSIIIVDGGDFAATAAYTIKPRGPLCWMDPGPFGTLGVGAGFALGAKLVCPDSEIWLIWGDGSSGYGLAEIDTFKRFGIGVICVIGNDACWSQIEREQIPKLGDNVACPLSYCDYDIVSKGFGGNGDVVWDKKQLDEKNNILERAKEFVEKERAPFVINAHIGTSDFREGSISV